MMVNIFIAGLCALTLLVNSPRYFFQYDAPKAAILAAGIFGLMGWMTIENGFQGQSSCLSWLLLLYMGYWSFGIFQRHINLWQYFIEVMCISWAYIISIFDPGRFLVYGILAAAGVIVLDAGLEFAEFSLWHAWRTDRGRVAITSMIGRRPNSPIGNPNSLGSFCAALLPVTIAMSWPFISFVLGIGLFLAQTRGAWIAAGFPFLTLVSSYFYSQRRDIFKDYSIQERLKYYRLAWRLIQESPWIGQGFGSFQIYAAREWRGETCLQHPHNQFLEIWHDGGIVGLLLYLSICVNALILLFHTENRMLWGIGAGLGVLMIDGLFSQSLRSLSVQVLFWSFIGLANTQQPGSVVTLPTVLRMGIGLAIFAIPNLAFQAMMADYHFKQGLIALRVDASSALRYYLKALRAYPYHVEARHAMASVLVHLGKYDLAEQETEKLLRIHPYFYQTLEQQYLEHHQHERTSNE